MSKGIHEVKTPVVLAAFGTTTKAMDTYAYMDKTIRERFPDHEIRWAYSSRMVRDFSKLDLKSPKLVLSDLAAAGYSWAVVQSIHLICGSEFERLISEIHNVPQIRTSVGFPLLHGPSDYDKCATGIAPLLPELQEEAAILVGHGTDHPMWAAYVALEHRLQGLYGSDVYVGMIENEGSCERIIEAVKGSGKRKAILIPFLIVAGVHFREDIAGVWKSRFERAGIAVQVIDKGLGFHPPAVEIFIDHIEQALEGSGFDS